MSGLEPTPFLVERCQLGCGSISITIDQFEHRVLNNVQRCMFVMYCENGLPESLTLDLFQKMTQFRFSGQVVSAPIGGNRSHGNRVRGNQILRYCIPGNLKSANQLSRARVSGHRESGV